MRNIDNNELRYYNASYNNSLVMETACLASIRQELIDFLNSLAEELLFSKINRPDTKCKVVDITNIMFYVNRLKTRLLVPHFFYQILLKIITV